MCLYDLHMFPSPCHTFIYRRITLCPDVETSAFGRCGRINIRQRHVRREAPCKQPVVCDWCREYVAPGVLDRRSVLARWQRGKYDLNQYDAPYGNRLYGNYAFDIHHNQAAQCSGGEMSAEASYQDNGTAAGILPPPLQVSAPVTEYRGTTYYGYLPPLQQKFFEKKQEVAVTDTATLSSGSGSLPAAKPVLSSSYAKPLIVHSDPQWYKSASASGAEPAAYEVLGSPTDVEIESISPGDAVDELDWNEGTCMQLYDQMTDHSPGTEYFWDEYQPQYYYDPNIDVQQWIAQTNRPGCGHVTYNGHQVFEWRYAHDTSPAQSQRFRIVVHHSWARTQMTLEFHDWFYKDWEQVAGVV